MVPSHFLILLVLFNGTKSFPRISTRFKSELCGSQSIFHNVSSMNPGFVILEYAHAIREENQNGLTESVILYIKVVTDLIHRPHVAETTDLNRGLNWQDSTSIKAASFFGNVLSVRQKGSLSA